jgi:hypothetical protein
MAERAGAGLRLLLTVLLAANGLFFIYVLLMPDVRFEARSRIEELQINPGRIRVLGVATRGPVGTAAGEKSNKDVPYRACLEWGPLTAADAAKAESALTSLALPHPPVQRPSGEIDGVRRFSYFVREPDAGIVARIAELQRGFPGSQIKAGPCPS